MRPTLTLFCILAASFAGFSQDKNFDLSKYKFPDYKRHELELNFNSNGKSSSWSATNGLNPDGTFKTVDYKDVYNDSGLNLVYSFTNNTRKRQEKINSYFRSSYRFDKSVNELGTATFSSPNANFFINAEEKYYLTENKWFLEVDPEFVSDIWSTNNRSPNADDIKRRGISFSAQIGLGGGIGRMEYVSDFWQAYYILEDLKKQGTLVRNLEERDVLEFATLASQLKSKRFFDFRLKKIDEMKSLDSLMHATHLIEHGDITYFSTLSDYWNFANISSRSSGRVLKLLITPGYSYQFNKQLGNNSKQTYNETHLNSELNFQCAKQLNLYWERNFNLNLSNMTTIDNDETSIYKYPKNFQRVNSNVGYSYYPNFRTQFRTTLSYQAYQFAGDLNEAGTEYKKAWSNNVGLHSSIYYYLSPQLRIEGNVGANYYDKRKLYSQKEKLDISYSLGFQYAIF